MPSLPPPHRPAQALLINNTANWQAGSKAAHDVVSRGELGKLRHVSCILASPLGWLFEGKEHANWTKVEGHWPWWSTGESCYTLASLFLHAPLAYCFKSTHENTRM